MNHPLSLGLHLVRCTGVRTKEELISQYFKEMGGELHGWALQQEYRGCSCSTLKFED